MSSTQSSTTLIAQPSNSSNDDKFISITRLNSNNLLSIATEKNLEATKETKCYQLIKSFKEIYKENPDYIVCAPGRVNLIGDHIDYHGFSVLPMAIEKCIYLSCSLGSKVNRQLAEAEESDKQQTKTRSGNATISLINSDQTNYATWNGSHSFSYGPRLRESHRWQHYVLCGYHGILTNYLLGIKPGEQLTNYTPQLVDDEKLAHLEDFNFFLDSNLPAASGLSSSSALVCASAVATRLLLDEHSLLSLKEDDGGGESTQRTKIITNKSNDSNINAHQMAEICSKFEHLIGTQGGGMDQAVIMTANEGYAKHVEFVPQLKCENVHLPERIVWLISNSGIEYPKAANIGYNVRVLETKLAAALIVKKLGARQRDFNSGKEIKLDCSITLSLVKSKIFKQNSSIQEILDLIKSQVFNEKNEFTIEEIANQLELSTKDLIKRFKTSEEFLQTLIDHSKNDKLQLLTRCEHVFEEAERVERFKSICDTTVVDIGQLGQLMTQSHYSLRDKYECSHPALDRLVSVALEAGALGSRLTGAGWGGCTISLVEATKCDTVLERLKEVSKFTFRTEPQSGCQVIRIFNEE